MKRFLVLLLIVISFFSACQTNTNQIPDNLSEGEYFLEAQKASSESHDYKKALAYYTAYIEKYPENTQMVIEAEYEIAFIYYQMEKYNIALERFNIVLDRYKTQEATLLPAWPRVLSTKLVDKIKQEIEQNTNNSESSKTEKSTTITDENIIQ